MDGAVQRPESTKDCLDSATRFAECSDRRGSVVRSYRFDAPLYVAVQRCPVGGPGNPKPLGICLQNSNLPKSQSYIAKMDGDKIVLRYHEEWTLGALLADDLTRAMMHADHVDPATVERLASHVSRRRENDRWSRAISARRIIVSREAETTMV
jgi:hypothetical protein